MYFHDILKLIVFTINDLLKPNRSIIQTFHQNKKKQNKKKRKKKVCHMFKVVWNPKSSCPVWVQIKLIVESKPN